MAVRGYACSNCRTWFEGPGARPRCPACGERASSETVFEYTEKAGDDLLEAPELLDSDAPKEEAPAIAFIAAMIAFTGLALIVLGAVLLSPLMFIAGFVVIFVTLAPMGLYSMGRNRLGRWWW